MAWFSLQISVIVAAVHVQRSLLKNKIKKRYSKYEFLFLTNSLLSVFISKETYKHLLKNQINNDEKQSLIMSGLGMSFPHIKE